MQIDPRTAKQLIELQLMNSINLQGTSLQNSTSVGSNDSFFNMLLQEMLTQTGEQSNGSSVDSLLNLDSNSSITSDNLWKYLPHSDQISTEPQIDSGVKADSSTSTGGKTTPYDDLIKEASKKYGVPESLIKAVIETESSFKPGIVSSAGAKGLMQLMDGTAEGLGVRNAFDPAQNIDAGVRYLSFQLRRFGGEEKMALAAYNAGPSKLRKLGIENDQQLLENLHLLPTETQRYITKIERARAKYEA